MRCCFLYSKDSAFYQQRVAKTISSAAHQLRIFDAHPPNQDVRSFDSNCGRDRSNIVPELKGESLNDFIAR
jgi:hypothetical protein